MNLSVEFPPALILLVGALIVPFCHPALRRILVVALPAAALGYILALPSGAEGGSLQPFSFLQDPIRMLRMDGLSRPFGIVFALNAVVVFIYAFYVRKSTQHTAALVYMGSALGVVFAGDLLSLYVFWEMMAVASTLIILSRDTLSARRSALRYLLVHLVGGLLLLAGVVLIILRNGGEIHFSPETINLAEKHAGIYLMVAGILVNAAAVPLGSWLPDAYPSASVTGGLILSAYTTKTSVYVLLRSFGPTEAQAAAGEAGGWEPLVWIGCIMSIYGVVYALLENDMRRILAYSIINQVGFMVCAAGIGTAQAISGASAHAFCHILYKSLLWMAAGAVLYRVGKSRCTELGGLHRTMPLTALCGTIGAFSCLGVPFTCGFVSKPVILEETLRGGEFTWAWLVLEIASASIVFHAGLKFPYLVFFHRDRGLRPREAPISMLLGMGALAAGCLFLGLFPGVLYGLLPYPLQHGAYDWGGLVHQMQMLAWAALAFFLCLRWIEPRPAVTLDFDWFYRRGSPLVYAVLDRLMNGMNDLAGRLFLRGVVRPLCRFFEAAPTRFLFAAMEPVWKLRRLDEASLSDQRQSLHRQSRRGAFSIGLTALLAVVLLALLSALAQLGR